MHTLKSSEEHGIRLSIDNRVSRHGSCGLKQIPDTSLRKKKFWLTSVLHSGSLACRPGINLMADDKPPLHEVTLLWCPTFERLASDFFSDAGDREARTVRSKVERRTYTITSAGLAFKGLAGPRVQCACLQ